MYVLFQKTYGAQTEYPPLLSESFSPAQANEPAKFFDKSPYSELSGVVYELVNLVQFCKSVDLAASI